MRNETVDIKAWIDNRPVGRYQWLIMGLCFFIVLFDGFDVAVMGFIAPSLIQEWGLSKAAFGPVMSAGMVGLAIGALTAGPYADRLGRKKVLLTAVTGFSVLSLLCAFARNPYELAALRLLTGVALGAALPNTTTLPWVSASTWASMSRKRASPSASKNWRMLVFSTCSSW